MDRKLSQHKGSWLHEIVLGLDDGLVSTLIFVMAVSASAPASLIRVILYSILAGGASMALGALMAARTEREVSDDAAINPLTRAAQVGLSYILGGFLPALPLLFGLPLARLWSYGLVVVIALAFGAAKSRYTGQSALRGGVEFLIAVTAGTLVGVALGAA